MQKLPKHTHTHMLRNPLFINRTTGKPLPNDTGWQDQHRKALVLPRGFEQPIVEGLAAWACYADMHRERYDVACNDHVLGAAWAGWGRALRALLNGETGRLDCGMLNRFICDTLASEGHRE